MKMILAVSALLALATVSIADDPNGAAPATPKPSVRPRQAPIVQASAPTGDLDKAATAPDAPKFISEAKWSLAGYNNNEVVYTILVTSQDARIIRCTTQIQGFYIQNGEKSSISDRQITTVFPNQPTQVGNWMDLDESSGATYSVKCHPV